MKLVNFFSPKMWTFMHLVGRHFFIWAENDFSRKKYNFYFFAGIPGYIKQIPLESAFSANIIANTKFKVQTVFRKWSWSTSFPQKCGLVCILEGGIFLFGQKMIFHEKITICIFFHLFFAKLGFSDSIQATNRPTLHPRI